MIGRRPDPQAGVLAATFMAAMELWAKQKADGVSFAERVTGLSIALRHAWPKGRAHAWKCLCTNCHDYGLAMSDCPGDATCGRMKPHLPHEYGTPCWCQAGARFKVTPKRAEDFTEAAKTRQQPTRVGRR